MLFVTFFVFFGNKVTYIECFVRKVFKITCKNMLQTYFVNTKMEFLCTMHKRMNWWLTIINIGGIGCVLITMLVKAFEWGC